MADLCVRTLSQLQFELRTWESYHQSLRLWSEGWCGQGRGERQDDFFHSCYDGWENQMTIYTGVGLGGLAALLKRWAVVEKCSQVPGKAMAAWQAHRTVGELYATSGTVSECPVLASAACSASTCCWGKNYTCRLGRTWPRNHTWLKPPLWHLTVCELEHEHNIYRFIVKI